MPRTIGTAAFLSSSANYSRPPFVCRVLRTAPPEMFCAPVKQSVRSYAAVFRWMPFSGNRRKAHQERILPSNLATGTEWTRVALVCSMPSSRLPFVSFRTDPPNWPSVIFLNIIRRDVSVFGGMPLSREQRMRLGERHKRLLPARGCPSLIHGSPCYRRRPPLPTKLLAPLQGAKYCWGIDPG